MLVYVSSFVGAQELKTFFDHRKLMQYVNF